MFKIAPCSVARLITCSAAASLAPELILKIDEWIVAPGARRAPGVEVFD
jgi:hypothetical protein